MTKIFCCSNWKQKFVGPIMEAWQEAGHEVEYRLGYDPELHEWSDVTFIDACDRNAQVASEQRFPDTRTVVRAIDIECWVGQPGGVRWKNMDGLIFGAKHIQDLVSSYVPFDNHPHLEIAFIPFGVDLSKWTYRTRSHGPNVAYIAHRWSAKGLPLLLQVMHKLRPEYKFHFLGDSSREKWLHAYIDQMIEVFNLDVTFTERVDSVDEWLEDKNFLIVSSQKEAFSYVAAEAAAKGIKPVIHNFYGARHVWPPSWIWNTVEQAAWMIDMAGYRSQAYRDYIEKYYSFTQMMYGINQICGL